jgi:hypothetical protein
MKHLKVISVSALILFVASGVLSAPQASAAVATTGQLMPDNVTVIAVVAGR